MANNITTMVGLTPARAQVAIPLTTTTGILGPVTAAQTWVVDSLYVSNTNATPTTVTITLDTNGTNSLAIVGTVSIPGNCTLVVIDNTSPVYMTDGDNLKATAASATGLNAFASYKYIS